MMKFAECVSPGHPDKVADYISQCLLDRYIEGDPATRYAVEVQIKGRFVTLGGEVTSRVRLTQRQVAECCRRAVREIGYTREYQLAWGNDNTIAADYLEVTSRIGQQSPDIARGLDGWGDQGMFFGYANNDAALGGMPPEHVRAKALCKALFDLGIGGLDIKTQVNMDRDTVTKAFVAIPLRDAAAEHAVRAHLEEWLPGVPVTLNGTGRYVQHGPVADCGTTGRKLAVDFYGGACRIGGGSPWTKDGSKADLTLNLHARELARRYAAETGGETYTSLACCIGRRDVDFCVCDAQGRVLDKGTREVDPGALRARYGLDGPIYASMCRWGLFGLDQKDKEWER